MRKGFIALGVLIILVLTVSYEKGGAMAERPDYRTQIKDKFSRLDLSDGVSKEEAVVIAQNYLIEKGIDKDCNIMKPEVKESQLVDNCWAVGFNAIAKVRSESGLEWFALHIDRTTGEIKGQGWGPS
ncbi:MAG: hypothetical protein PHN59_00330 [Candidatus Omnitrophica bacterium]|nr:hypothetical protein [Candidatus Omnitrophota bacterium]